MKSIRIRSFSGPYFPPFELITERYGVFLLLHIRNAERYGSEKRQIRKLFTQWQGVNLMEIISKKANKRASKHNGDLLKYFNVKSCSFFGVKFQIVSIALSSKADFPLLLSPEGPLQFSVRFDNAASKQIIHLPRRTFGYTCLHTSSLLQLTVSVAPHVYRPPFLLQVDSERIY